MRSKILFPLICIQLAVAIFLGIKVYRQTKVLGVEVTITPIDEKSVSLNLNSELKNFYEPKPNSTQVDRAPWLENEIVYHINSDSLRESTKYEIDKPDSTFRIITLGDSFTFGASVFLKDNYPKQLEKLLNSEYKCTNIQKFEIINLGVRGYDVQYATERFILRGKKYNPDLILWLLKSDDFFQVEDIMRPLAAGFMKELHDNNELGYNIDENGKVSYSWFEKALNMMQDSYSRQEILDYQMSAMGKMNNHYNKQLVILTFPLTKYIYKQEIKNFAESKANIHFYESLARPMQADEIQPDGHPTSKGYSLMVNDIFNYLKNESLIPCD